MALGLAPYYVSGILDRYPYFSWIIPPGRSQVVRANQPPICFSHVHGHLEEVPQPDPERERLLNIKHGEYKPLTTYSNWDDPPSVRAILLMEEILHHLRCTKHYKTTYKQWDFNYQTQLVQDFSHQQHHCSLPFAPGR